MGIRVRRYSCQPPTKPPPELYLQRIVVGAQPAPIDLKSGRIWVTHRLSCKLTHLKQSCPVRADIRNSQRLGLSEGLLHAAVPLKCVGKLQVRRKGEYRAFAGRDGRIDDGRSCLSHG